MPALDVDWTKDETLAIEIRTHWWTSRTEKPVDALMLRQKITIIIMTIWEESNSMPNVIFLWGKESKGKTT